MSKILLALDQSTTTTGFAIFSDRKLIKSGTISFSESDYLKRTVRLKTWMLSLIQDLGSGNVEVALEDIQLQHYEPNGGKIQSKDFGVTTYKKLAHLQGVLMATCLEYNIKCTVTPPSTWRKTCNIQGSYRNEKKQGTVEFIEKQYNKTVSSDEADAICLGYHVLQEQGLDWS